jgi:FADH2 O2-dependent halogenase
MQADFDVGIIGGGPAGSSMAAYLAKAGINCVVFESALFPRPHVGESFVPSSTRVFRELEFLPVLESSGFPKKFGAAWTSHTKKTYAHDIGFDGLPIDNKADVQFAEREQPGVEQPYTYHVDRGKFDLLMLQHANGLGAKVYEGVTVQNVDFSDPVLAAINYTIGKKQVKTHVRMVVDATGRKTLLARQMKWRIVDPVFDQYAIHTWFEGYDRRAMAYRDNTDNYIFIHFLPITNTWVWQIPINDTVTSIGVVTQKKNFAQSRESREQFFWDCLASRPELYDAARAAQQIRQFTEEGDYSYASQQLAGDRLVLVGDAGRFVDPIFSTGVSIALNCSRFAQRDIIKGLEMGRLDRSAFNTFETTIRRGTRNWYRFISVYYRLNVLFTSFILDPRYRLDVLKLLQGDVYDEDEPAVLVKMRDTVNSVERDANHILHRFLGDLTANAFVEANEGLTMTLQTTES